MTKNFFLPFALAVGLQVTPPGAVAADTPTNSTISLELNKLQPLDGKGCLAYFVVDNPTPLAFASFKLDLIFFGTDGIIARTFTFDLAPIRAGKKSVRGATLEGLPCTSIGSVLISDVLDCKADSTPGDCLDKLTVSSKAGVPASK